MIHESSVETFIWFGCVLNAVMSNWANITRNTVSGFICCSIATTVESLIARTSDGIETRSFTIHSCITWFAITRARFTSIWLIRTSWTIYWSWCAFRTVATTRTPGTIPRINWCRGWRACLTPIASGALQCRPYNSFFRTIKSRQTGEAVRYILLTCLVIVCS